MQKNNHILKTTTSRSTYNRSRKYFLANDGQIYCSFCKYHKNENLTTKWYGGNSSTGVRYPSWKLASKNKKQWMNKQLLIETEEKRLYRFIHDSEIVTHYDISFKRGKY